MAMLLRTIKEKLMVDLSFPLAQGVEGERGGGGERPTCNQPGEQERQGWAPSLGRLYPAPQWRRTGQLQQQCGLAEPPWHVPGCCGWTW